MQSNEVSYVCAAAIIIIIINTIRVSVRVLLHCTCVPLKLNELKMLHTHQYYI